MRRDEAYLLDILLSARRALKYALPDQFELLILPEDDPEIRLYNLELLDKYGSEGMPVVFARLTSSNAPAQMNPSIFVPVAA